MRSHSYWPKRQGKSFPSMVLWRADFIYRLSAWKQTKGFVWYTTLVSEIQNRALDTIFSFVLPACWKENSNVRRGLEFWCASNWLTPLIKALLEKLTVPQPVKQFPAFYGIRRFIAEFTRARHLSVSSARCIQSIPSPHPLFIRRLVILLTASCYKRF